MIQLRNRTEFSFKTAVGKLPAVLAKQDYAAGITDRHGTWGHAKWARECAKTGIKPLFGVELAVVSDATRKDRQVGSYMSFLAQSQVGLQQLYELTTLATQNFYYIPRIDYRIIKALHNRDIIVLSGPAPDWSQVPKGLPNFFVELNQLSSLHTLAEAKRLGYQLVATGDNLYCSHSDLAMYQIILEDKAEMSTAPRHILEEWEWFEATREKGVPLTISLKAIGQARKIADLCSVKMPKAKMVHPKVKQTLEQMCLAGAKHRGINLNSDPDYSARCKRELKLIHEKEFNDYFFVVTDMIRFAKKNMMVGPARGSSCGSLVCYLLGITDIDPMVYGLLFERFIDVNREDFPDIDIDFQDDRREMVFDYLRDKYGFNNVARLGNVSTFKAKSAITAVAKQLRIPMWEINDLKNSILERSTGDARAQFCIADTFEQLDIGKATLLKYPELALASELEGHASHSGTHAAGIVITADDVSHYCAMNAKTGNAMIDLHDAEDMSMLKIDALGLRTLTVLQDTLDQVGWSREKLKTWPMDDKRAFKILDDGKFCGIFQFEGYALQSVAKQLSAHGGIKKFEDIANITALARPGPFNSGGTSEFIERHIGAKPVEFLHPLVKDITKVTYGVIVYQEQVMQIAREVGALSWDDVSELRKAMSKSLGDEYFNIFWLKFYKGAAKKHNLSHATAEKIWKSINTMGSWAFNRSHAVAYGTISYWCCVVKAYHPLEFAAACLRNSKDDDQSVKILRELVREGYQYKAFDPLLSEVNWSVKDGRLIGGLTSIKQVGEKIATGIVAKRATHGTPGAVEFSPREIRLLNYGTTPWDRLFECKDLWGHVFKNPKAYKIESDLLTLEEIGKLDGESKTIVFIAKLQSKNLRDHNEEKNIVRREGKVMSGQTLYLNLTVEDDTESNRIVTIGRRLYMAYGKPIVESGRIGEWFLWKAEIDNGRIFVVRCRKMTGNEDFTRRIPRKK